MSRGPGLLSRLGEFAEVRARIGWRGLSSSEYQDDGPFLIAGQHIRDGRVDWRACDHVSEWRYLESSEIAVQPGDVILTKDGTIGRVARIDSVPGRATLNGTMMLVRPRPGLDYRYLAHVLGGYGFQKLVADRVSGSSIPHLFQRDLVQLEIGVPDLAEQRRIAEILDTIDEAIRSAQHLIAKLRHMRTALLAATVWSHPRAKKVPVSAIGRTLSDVAIGPFGSNLVASDYRSKGAPVVFVQDVRAGEAVTHRSKVFVTEEKARTLSAHRIESGDIAVTKMGSPPGAASLYPISMAPGIVTADILRLRCDPQQYEPAFVVEAINSPRCRSQVGAITGGVTRPKITLRDFRAIELWVPDLRTQHEQLGTLSVLDDRLSSQIDSADKLVQVRRGLQADLLSGRVRSATS